MQLLCSVSLPASLCFSLTLYYCLPPQQRRIIDKYNYLRVSVYIRLLELCISTGCPFQKEFKFIYPEHQADSELVRLPVGINVECILYMHQCYSNNYNYADSDFSSLFLFQMNYRPPSPLGSSLPTSPHVYNADPSQPLSSTYFKISQV